MSDSPLSESSLELLSRSGQSHVLQRHADAVADYQASLRSSWLLRLFQSDFFDARLALVYLHKYPDAVGIQHYICTAIRSFPEADIRFLLPQICHMLVTRPEESVAIEGLITDLCRSSQHIAIMTLWYLEAYLQEMHRRNVHNASFLLCQRMYHTCQTIVFDDTPAAAQTADATHPSNTNGTDPDAVGAPKHHSRPIHQQNELSTTTPRSRSHSARSLTAARNNCRIPPAIVGIGVMMSSFAAPSICQKSATMIRSQAAHPRLVDGPLDQESGPTGIVSIINDFIDDDDDYHYTNASDDTDELHAQESPDSGTAAMPAYANQSGRSLPDPQFHPVQSDAQPQQRPRGFFSNLKLLARIPTSSPSLEELSKGSAFSFTNFLRKTSVFNSQSAHSSHPNTNHASNRNSIAVQPYSTIQNGTIISHFPPSSSMSLNERRSFDASQVRRGSANLESTSTASTTIASAIVRDQAHLLKSHYFHAEMQFIMTLVDISDRLRYVPKSARQSMLVAELTLLNHNLPADVCIPFLCPAEAGKQHHHRVARISPSDAVVLNSADRVPYLIMIEVLQPDQPTSTSDSPKTPTESHRQNQPNSHSPSQHLAAVPEQQRTSFDSQVLESRRSMSSDTSTSPSLTSAEYYREVMQRRKSFSTAAKQHAQNSSPSLITADLNAVALSPDGDAGPVTTSANSATGLAKLASPHHPPVSTDEFSERMRTAAVMLAQLYQQQQRELTALTMASSTTATPTPQPQRAGILSSLGSGSIWSEGNTAPSSGASTPPLSHDRSRTPSSAPLMTAPASSALDRRTYNKLRTDFEEIRARLIKEMMSLEQQRIEVLSQQLGGSIDVMSGVDDILPEQQERRIRTEVFRKDAEDPSASVFREPWSSKRERIRRSSPYGHLPNWDILSVIVKSGADLRQELLALQLIAEMDRIWKQAGVDVWVYSFRMLITSEHSALIETIRDAISIHSIKKEGYARQLNQQGIAYTLYDYFIKEFGQPGCESFERAQDNFMRSLAGYSIACYLLQIKDRHNGNILMDLEGHCIHIDFGFVLTNSPGSVGFELAPFKLPQEYIDILGGLRSAKFIEFRALLRDAFIALRKSADAIVCLVEAMEKDSTLPCFTGVTPKPTAMASQTQSPPPSAAAAVMAAAAAITRGSAQGQSGVAGSGALATMNGGVLHGHMSPGSMSGSPANVPTVAITSPSSATISSTTTIVSATTATTTATASANVSSVTTTASTNKATKPASATKYPVTEALRERFQLGLTDTQVTDFIDRLINSSCNNMFTKLYDSFQYYANGIL